MKKKGMPFQYPRFSRWVDWFVVGVGPPLPRQKQRGKPPPPFRAPLWIKKAPGSEKEKTKGNYQAKCPAQWR